MKHSLLPVVLPLLALALPGCFSSPLPCRLDPIQVTGDATDSGGEMVPPQAAVVDLTHSPDGCLSAADIRVVGPGGEDCELRALSDGTPHANGIAVTQFTLSSTGDCGWPASLNGSSAGTGDSWFALDGSVDVAGGEGDTACVLGTVSLVLATTLNGNSSETITGTYWFTDGLASVRDNTASCPAAAGDDDDSAR